MTLQTNTGYETSLILHYKENTMSSHVSFESLCNSILRLNKSIQSVVIINNKGRVIEKISRPEFTKLYPDHLSEFFCMSCVLQVSMGRDFDENYGPVNYHISERANLTMIISPLDENVILVTAYKNTSPITLARKIVDLTSKYRKRF
jgi:hypothetical protein